MSMSDFLVNIDGIDKTAHIVTRLEVTGTGVEYIYYNVDGEKDENGDLYLFTSRVKSNEDGTDEIIEIENEDEKKIAFEIFSKIFIVTQTPFVLFHCFRAKNQQVVISSNIFC